MVQVYTQLVIRSMEIEKQIAFDNNNLASFGKKWATFKHCPSEYNLTKKKKKVLNTVCTLIQTVWDIYLKINIPLDFT